MRSVIALLTALLATRAAASDPATEPMLHERIQNADLIAIVSVVPVTNRGAANPLPTSGAALSTDCATERVLKGKPQTVIKIRLDDPMNQERASSGGHFLIFANKSGNIYVPDTFYGFCHILEARPSSDTNSRIVWPNCTSVAEAISTIQSALTRKATVLGPKQSNAVAPSPRQSVQLLPTQWTERLNSKSQWVDLPDYGRRAFMWGFLPGATSIWSEPGCGVSYIDIVKQNPSELVFKITTNYGLPINFATGKAPVEPTAAVSTARPAPEWFEPLTRRAFSALKKKASEGLAAAQYDVGARTADGIGVKRNTSEGYGWLMKAAQQGEMRAERRVGEMLTQGRGTDQDLSAGVEWLLKAANGGDDQAQLDLAIYYVRRTNAPPDDAKAFELFSKLANRGDSTAQRSIGGMYAAGDYVPKDLKTARDWWEKAAAQNEPQALYNLAMLHFQEGGATNKKAAISCLVKAALPGSIEAEVILGKAYATGNGVPEDATRAMDLLEDAGRSGNAEAQMLVGALLRQAKDRPFHAEDAAVWLRQAALRGSADAQRDLGLLYRTGEGVKRDDVEALKWLSLAAVQNSGDAAGNKKEISLFMTSEQKHEAERRAKQFKPVTERPIQDGDAAAESVLTDEFRIPVTFLGKKQYLLVDTDATVTYLDARYREFLGEPIAKQIIHTAIGEQEFEIYNCPAVQIGYRRFAPLWTGCGPFEKLPKSIGEPCAGVLGMVSLRRYVVVFDPDRHRFCLGGTVPEIFRKKGAIIPLKTVPGCRGPVVEARVNGAAPVYFELDTGFTGSISLSERDWKSLFRDHEPKTIEKTFVSAGDREGRGKMGRVRSLAIGSNKYTNLLAMVATSANTSSQLGQGFFHRHVCAIDFPGQKLYLLPGERFFDRDEEDMSGISPMRIGESIIVHTVKEGSPAFKAGIRQDDVIISLNWHDAPSLGIKAINDLLRSGDGDEVTIQVTRKRQTIEFTFKLKRFI